jgi:hypothetical protein
MNSVGSKAIGITYLVLYGLEINFRDTFKSAEKKNPNLG